MIIICGKTIAEVERDLEMAKQAIASGMPYGVGGATIADAERGLEVMRAVCGEQNAPIDNPNYDPCYGCSHWKPNNECEVGYDCEDEEDVDICPACGADYDEGWDGEVCHNCGYGDEDEDESIPTAIVALGEMLRYLGADEDTIDSLLN